MDATDDGAVEPLDELWRRGADVSSQPPPCNARWEVTVHSVKQTERLGAKLGALLDPGAVVTLDGDLGAGKTTFVRGLAAGIGVSADEVTSPTFTLLHEYEGDVPLYHFDVYRLDAPEEFFALGAEEYLYGDGVCVIEWGGTVRAELPPERLEIVLHRPEPEEDAREERPTGPGGRPATYGCSGADHWGMHEDELDAARRHVDMCAYGPRPTRWLEALRDEWEAATGGGRRPNPRTAKGADRSGPVPTAGR